MPLLCSDQAKVAIVHGYARTIERSGSRTSICPQNAKLRHIPNVRHLVVKVTANLDGKFRKNLKFYRPIRGPQEIGETLNLPLRFGQPRFPGLQEAQPGRRRSLELKRC